LLLHKKGAVMSNPKRSKKKKKVVAYAAKKLFKLLGITTIYIGVFSLIIAAVYYVSFMNTEKNIDYRVKLRTQQQTKAVTVKSGDSSIISKGYLPLSVLNGHIGFRVVGNSEGITVSNPSETEVMEIVPNSNIIKVNGVWKSINEVVLYNDGECYLPMDLLEKYTCLSVSYDEDNSLYTVSLNGDENISFFPQSNSTDTTESEES
jgi:hypothetical protein